MATPVRRRATYQDVLDAPPGKIAEVIDGELHLSSRPRFTHSSVGTTLTAWLVPPFQHGRGGPGDWLFLFEPELHFGDDIVVPDLAGWRTERLPVIEDVAFATLAPDWLCEILSRSTEKTDRVDKLPIYAAAGVAHVWLVHPLRRTLEVLRRNDAGWQLAATYRDDQRVHPEPFDAIELDLAILWRALAGPSPRRDRASEPAAVYRVGDPAHDDAYHDDASHDDAHY
jgi:Uma2 family endonuclease